MPNRTSIVGLIQNSKRCNILGLSLPARLRQVIANFGAKPSAGSEYDRAQLDRRVDPQALNKLF